MSLRLVIESAAHPQPMPEKRHEGGDLSIGRGADCDWQIEDPDMFVSRRHCVISGREGRFEVTDASRGGLFIDGSDRPLGAGNSAPLQHGMRLRLGDVVVRVEIAGAAKAAGGPRETAPADDFFARPVETPATPARPESLPEPFETGRPSGSMAPPASREAIPPAFDDPFTLDPVAMQAEGRTPAARRPEAASFTSDAFWSDAQVTADAAPVRNEEPQRTGFDDPFAPLEPTAEPVRETATADLRNRDPGRSGPEAAPPEPAAAAPDVRRHQGSAQADLAAAFLRGAGLDGQGLSLSGSPAEMEELGRRFRLLAEGLVALLRARAREKGSARLAQTVIGATDVNPLKFLPTTDEALAALVTPRGRGYLAPDDAINGAFRDISDHHIRNWIAIQSALRRMIDRFDPAAFEAEADKEGLMKALLAGGRSAKLWQLYAERYREIAKSAEDRFLGEVGADFRDAYEGNRKQKEEDR